MDAAEPQPAQACCERLFYAHFAAGRDPPVVLECCSCGRLWRRREDGELEPYYEKTRAGRAVLNNRALGVRRVPER